MVDIEDREKILAALEFAKLMTEQEVLDNKKKKYKSTFWASIVNILFQKLNIVQVRRDDG